MLVCLAIVRSTSYSQQLELLSMRNPSGTISKIRAASGLSGKVPRILAVELLSKNLLSHLIRFKKGVAEFRYDSPSEGNP